MKKITKTTVIAFLSWVLTVSDVAAQKISAAAVVEQHYATQTANYKLMMLGLALVYAVYAIVYNRRKKEVNRFMGKAEMH